MKIAVFIAGMILAMVAVGAWSVASGAGLWVTVLRVAGTAIVAQLLYLVTIALMARSGGTRPESETPRRDENPPIPFPRRDEAADVSRRATR